MEKYRCLVYKIEKIWFLIPTECFPVNFSVALSALDRSLNGAFIKVFEKKNLVHGNCSNNLVRMKP